MWCELEVIETMSDNKVKKERGLKKMKTRDARWKWRRSNGFKKRKESCLEKKRDLKTSCLLRKEF